MLHVEFFHKDHFQHRYYRKKARPSLSQFVDFFWETDFDPLFEQYPQGFSDALFPNVGYTYLINLGTPFVMQLEQEKFEVKGDSFLPRHKNMVCHHSAGNRIFGIKFNVSPVLFQKKVNFSEYREYLFPLAYLIDRSIIEQVKKAPSFASRMEILSDYYENIIRKHAGALRPVAIVTQVLKEYAEKNCFDVPVEAMSEKYDISTRTLQRYFEATTSITSKQALQIIRIRKAIEKLISDPGSFHFSQFGYYDYSHFHKHLKKFIGSHSISVFRPHLHLLRTEHPVADKS